MRRLIRVVYKSLCWTLPGMEERLCECNQIVKQEFDRLTPIFKVLRIHPHCLSFNLSNAL